MAAGDYDLASRYAIRLDPDQQIPWALGDTQHTLVFYRWLDPRAIQLPGVSDRTGDAIAELHSTLDRRWHGALLVEFQSRPERSIAGMERWLHYISVHRGGLRWGENHRGRYEVSLVVFNLTGKGRMSELKMGIPGISRIGTTTQVLTVNLEDYDAVATLAGIRAGSIPEGVLVWVPLMQGAADPAIIEEWRALLSRCPDEVRRSDYVALALVLSELPALRAVWEAGLAGCNMERSGFMLEWAEKARAEGEARGRAEGEARGRAEGEARGRAEGEAGMLMRLARARLGEPDAGTLAQLEHRIAAGDADLLADRLLQVETWGEFLV